jgi:hypothetical protein
MTKPSINGVEFDPAAERERGKEREANAQKERLMKLLDDPTVPADLKRDIALRAGLTGARATGAEGAQIMGRAGQEDGQTFQGGQADKFQLTAEQKMAEAAKRRRRAGAGAVTKADDDDVFDPDTGAKMFDASTPAQAKELNENGRTMARVRAEMQELKAEYAKLPSGFWESVKQGNPIGNFFLTEEQKTALQNVNRLKTSITGQTSQMKGMGAPSTTELGEVQKGLVRGRSQSQDSYGQAADAAVKSLEGGWRRSLPAHGFKGGTPPAATAGPAGKAGPKEGDTSTLSSGTPIVFRGGKWVTR